MKNKSIKLIICIILSIAVSCDEPETVVTNYVHPDGSVTRKIEMRNSKNNFAKDVLQVPYDSTWSVKDSCEISIRGDTTWIIRAEKEFKNINEINLTYKADSGPNKEITRYTGFNKRFRWFNTEYRFSESIDKKLEVSYNLKDFLDDEELLYFYSPESMNYDKETGADSIKYKALSDSVNMKVESWLLNVFVSEWIASFSKLTEEKAGNDQIRKLLKDRESEIVEIIKNDIQKFDSLWSAGVLLKEFIGEENAVKYKPEADTTIETVSDKVFDNFKSYSVRIVMPGKVIRTNGFIDSSEVLLWPVKSDYFLTDNYEMWAESKIPNRWAWIVSGLFLVFVFTGLVIRIKKG